MNTLDEVNFCDENMLLIDNEFNIFEEGSNGSHTQKSFGKFCALYKVPKIYLYIFLY